MYEFAGQTVIITGGTRGIGRSTAESFLRADARVIVTYSSDEAAAAQFKQDNNEFADNIDIPEIQRF